jgi:hypothetical protein
MFELTLQQVALRLLAMLPLAAAQGLLAATAVALGDPGPRQDGHLTAWPLPHLDLVGTPLAVLFGFGWLRPIAVDPGRVRAGLPLLLTIATLIPLALAAVFHAIRPAILPLLPDEPAEIAAAFVRVAEPLYAGIALLGLLPFPPLPGHYLVLAAWPGSAPALRRAEPFAAALLALAIAAGLAGTALRLVKAM